MRFTGKALIGALVLGATGLACADGLRWAARDAGATLVPGGVAAGTPVYVCRATVGAVVAIGKFASDRSGECRVAANGAEQVAVEFELLAVASKQDATFGWVPGHATGYPLNSVVGGRAADGQRTLVCAAVTTADNSVHPGFIADENCVYAADGQAKVSDNYLVLVTDDPEVTVTPEAQPSVEGFDPAAILATGAVTSLCGLADGICASAAAR